MHDTEYTSEEWEKLNQLLSTLSEIQQETEKLTARANKSQNKLLESQESSRYAVASKLYNIYDETVLKTMEEQKIINQALEMVSALIDNKEGHDRLSVTSSVSDSVEFKKKKRKAEDTKLESSKGKRKPKGPDENSRQSMSPEGILSAGDQVAVRPAQQDWILAVVLRYLPEKQKYEVEDAEDDENNPGTRRRYIFPIRGILPIPKDVSRKKEFPIGHAVLALYPASSCFYKAYVVTPPSKNKESLVPNTYIVRFEDDEGFERYVSPNMVLDYPKNFKLK